MNTRAKQKRAKFKCRICGDPAHGELCFLCADRESWLNNTEYFCYCGARVEQAGLCDKCKKATKFMNKTRHRFMLLTFPTTIQAAAKLLAIDYTAMSRIFKRAARSELLTAKKDGAVINYYATEKMIALLAKDKKD